MKLLSKHTLLAGLLATAGFATLAQTPPPPPQGPGADAPHMSHHDPAQWQAMMAQRRERRLAKLKAELKITPQQEGAWNAFTQALEPSAPPAAQNPDHMRGEFAKMTTPERIDRMRAIRDQRDALMDQRDIATKTFYAALSPGQQQVFDRATLRMMHGHGHHWKHPG